MNYPIIIENTPKGFGAYCPDLPGCVATASTMKECIQLMHEAMLIHIEGLKEDGLPIPPASKAEYIDIPPHVLQA